MDSLSIYYPDGELPFTDRVDYASIESHVTAGDALSAEASLLREFHDA